MTAMKRWMTFLGGLLLLGFLLTSGTFYIVPVCIYRLMI